ncbi:Putative phospholipase D/Transphosphatidylase [Septoria linicola]|uniref:Phospholipase D/Transphosphatidylase n=1 Tax=Septoria linicola TaxID=215465 RepID=A0A9Q9AWI6_9PEZI|nr:putative phospholipase D/Transphosphatidylase [Septoria linicola]USW53830.1 Putative phospholipase D/Transphosphatidylase [Septoria linicola]
MGDLASVHDITFGTGHEIYGKTILPAIEAAQDEVILVTCFWAASDTRNAVKETLLKLNSTAVQRGDKKIRVRIGFSSCSLFQKLFHTSSPAGRTYTPSEWTKKLGLPAQEAIPGLDLQVKSIFFLPFSVWHPKFVIIDGKEVFLPSCNVSWEDWFEGCVRFDGLIVRSFIDFWISHWKSQGDNAPITVAQENLPSTASVLGLANVACKFLPSSHHRNPNFRLPWQQCAPAPKTPLNVELLDLFAGATRTIYMQTPNVTCPPVLDALLQALKRGVNVTILTSEKLMILEQLVTAGTTTSRCVRNLIRKHEALLLGQSDEEAGFARVGSLQISYYVSRAQPKAGSAEPVQSHLKLTIVDGEAIVFGSGNMDRASWFTSQELGVAFYSGSGRAKKAGLQ